MDQDKLRNKFITEGVKMIDASTVYFCEDTIIGKNVEIEPFVVIREGVTIENDVVIKSFTHIENSIIRRGTFVGPFARLRGGVELCEDVQIGNFVEIKNSKIHNGAKINHLSYAGDAEIGEKTNIGAGVITCNYDGFSKNKTTIGKNAFVGSNSALVAPITINDGAIVGAGSVITKDVAENNLAVSRPDLLEIPEGATKFREKRQTLKK